MDKLNINFCHQPSSVKVSIVLKFILFVWKFTCYLKKKWEKVYEIGKCRGIYKVFVVKKRNEKSFQTICYLRLKGMPPYFSIYDYQSTDENNNTLFSCSIIFIFYIFMIELNDLKATIKNTNCVLLGYVYTSVYN